MGGWIATNASGMKKNKYGNIEDLVLDVSVATAAGTLERTSASPRESVGMDLRRLMFGSEGTLGIITSAVVKIFQTTRGSGIRLGPVSQPSKTVSSSCTSSTREADAAGERPSGGQSAVPVRTGAEAEVAAGSRT